MGINYRELSPKELFEAIDDMWVALFASGKCDLTLNDGGEPELKFNTL